MIPTTQRKQVGSLHKPLAAQPCCPTESSGLAAQGPPTAWAVCAWPPTDFRPCRVAPQQPGLLHTPLPLACCTSASNRRKAPGASPLPQSSSAAEGGSGPGTVLTVGLRHALTPGCHVITVVLRHAAGHTLQYGAGAETERKVSARARGAQPTRAACSLRHAASHAARHAVDAA